VQAGGRTGDTADTAKHRRAGEQACGRAGRRAGEHGRVQHGLGEEGLAGRTAGRAPGTGRTRASTTRARGRRLAEEGLAGRTAGRAPGMGRTRASTTRARGRRTGREDGRNGAWDGQNTGSGNRLGLLLALGWALSERRGWIPVIFKEKARVPPEGKEILQKTDAIQDCYKRSKSEKAPFLLHGPL